MGSGDNQLFVVEEEEDDDMNREVKQVEVEDIDMMDSEEEDETRNNGKATYDEDDDPIVQEIPLNITGKQENLHLFQYANKAKLVNHKPSEHPVIAAARYKSNSALWELDIPLDVQAFYNELKAEENWNGVKIQTLKGVGVETNGQYAAFMSDGQAYLIPIKTTTQLKPYFKYIDDVNVKRRQEESKLNPTPSSQKAQVVTMSVKSVNDAAQNRLAGSLLAHKIADEELPVNFTWAENTTNQFREAMVKESSEHIIKPTEKEDEYLIHLL